MNNTVLEAIWDLRDRRVDHWPLMGSPLPTVLASSAYFYAVKFLGPSLMEGRKPYDLRKTIIAYNFVQVLFSSWLVYEILMSGWLFDYSFFCEPLDSSPENAKSLRMATAAWWYFFSKFTEFFDTFFFVLRKKTSHVSFLHVLHHGLMPLFAWEACRFVPGGHESFGALFNSFVHVVMYTYYFLAAFGPTFQKWLWWKRYLTRLQMVQFAAVLGHSLLLAFNNECGFPVIQSVISSAHMILFFILFMQFYIKSYRNKNDKELAKQE